MDDSSEPARPADEPLAPPPPLAADDADDAVRADSPGAPAVDTGRPSTGAIKVLSIIVMVAGLVLMIAGVVTWFVVRDQLAAEQIVVSDDADFLAGEPVEGPFTAYAQAEVINDHALEASGGLTYAQLDQDDPVRQTVMTASFLRASLFTSIVSFGVAVFAFGMGILMILIGWALLRIEKSLRLTPRPT
jgi:hypothetical protein